METTPTETDLGRDLGADLRLCEAATPGPWIFDPAHPLMATRGAQANVDGYWRAPEVKANAAFIAAARDGWPAAIRRALAAERAAADLRAERDELAGEAARLRELHARACDRIVEQSDLLTARAARGPAAPQAGAEASRRPGGRLSDPDALAPPKVASEKPVGPVTDAETLPEK